MNHKKLLSLTTLLALGSLVSCGGTSTPSTTENSNSTNEKPNSTEINNNDSTSSNVDSTNKEIDISSLKIVSPTGAPAFAFYNQYKNKNYETNSTPTNIVSMLTEKSDKDVIVIDTVSGIKAINNGAPYKLASTITFGNFYLVSTGLDDNDQIDPGDKIAIFGQNQTPDLVFHYIYGSQYDENIEYVTAASDTASIIASGKNLATSSNIDYVFSAEPVITTALPKNTKASIFKNIQEEYTNKAGENKTMIQASIFVRDSKDADYNAKLNKLLNDLNKDIDALIKDSSLLDKTLGTMDSDEEKAKYGTPIAPVKLTLNNNNSMGLGYKKASENKESIDNFISIFGLSATNESIYF